MNVGIIQGRLTYPSEGHQTTPINWQNEFILSKNLGLTHVEWNIDNNKNETNNPIFFEKVVLDYIDMISSVCFDTVVDKKIFEEDFFVEKVYDSTEKLLNIGLSHVTLPILEGACIDSEFKLKKIIEILRSYKSKFKDVEISLEMDCEIHYTEKILNSVECNLTYDTGNLTYKNIDHSLYIDTFLSKIKNVHLKDRLVSSGASLSDFNGDTPFELIFEKLGDYKYKELFTLQMARKENLSEVELIQNYLEHFRGIYEKKYF